MSRGNHDETVQDDGGAEAAAEPAAERPWRYELLHERARGGLGRVWVAHDHELGRVVALKELIAAGGAGEARFAREARLTARLEHPSVVPVHDAGVRPGAGTRFYAMKLVSGQPLDEAIRATRTLAERLALLPRVLAVAEAVAYAHSVDIVHRDLKPANVLLGAYGETLVIDWGLALELGEDDQAVQGGAVVGTPAFMAPEQARGERVDPRADVWALGAILYHLLAGAPPYGGTTGPEVVSKVAAGPPPPLPARAPEVPDDLAAIVGKAMAREPAERYEDAAALADDLRRFLAGRLVAAHRYTAFDRVVRAVRRHRALAATVAIALLVAIAGGAWFAVREAGLRRVAEHERARADAERARAEHMNLGLLEQQARAELAAGRPRRAAPLVAELLRRHPQRLVVRHMAAQVAVALEAAAGELVGHERDVAGLAYTPDGRFAVTGSNDRSARLWDLASGQVVRRFGGHAGAIEHLAVSADGRRLATGGGGRVIVHDLADGARLLELEDRDAYRVAFAAGDTLWVAGLVGGVRVYDARGRRVLDLAPHYDRVQALAVSADGTRVVTGGFDGQVILWDALARRELARGADHRGHVDGACFSADGRHLATSDSSGVIRVRDAASLAVLATIEPPAGARKPLVFFTPDGQRVVAVSADGVLRVWHAASGALLGALDVEAHGRVIAAALSPAGDELLASGPGGPVRRWRLPGGARLVGRSEPGSSRAVTTAMWAGTPPGEQLVTLVERGADQPGELIVRRSADGEVRHRVAIPVDPAVAVADPSVTRVVVTSENIARSADVSLWDLAAGAPVAHLGAHEGRVYDVAGAPDGTWFASAGRDGTVRRWELASGAARGEPWRLPGRVSSVAVSPDGARVAAASEDSTITFFDAASGAVVGSIEKAHGSWVQHLAYSADGTRLLSVGRQDKIAKIWALPEGRLVVTLAPHADNGYHGSFSADGRLAATVSVDGELRVWDAATGELLRSFAGPMYSAAFAPAGAALLASGPSGLVVVYDLGAEVPGDLAARVARESPWRLVEGRLELK